MSRFLNQSFSSLSAYTPGEQPTDGSYIKLNTNESPFPPEKCVQAAMEQELSRLNLYPDPTGGRLRSSLASYYGLKADNISLGNGSDELLNFAFMAFGGNGVAIPDISYGFYPVYAALYRLPVETIPLKADLTVDADAFAAAKGMVVLANPNAPTGLCLSASQIEKILQADRNRLVLVDEAYVEFGAESCLPLLGKYDNLLLIRTYSKSRSLAGARLGFAMAGEEIIRDLELMRGSTNPYNISRVTLAAGLAALDQEALFEAHCEEIARVRDETRRELIRLGFEVTDSKANFLFAAPPDRDGGAFYRWMKAHGILIRHFDKPRIREYVRISVGSAEQMTVFIEASESYLTGKG